MTQASCSLIRNFSVENKTSPQEGKLRCSHGFSLDAIAMTGVLPLRFHLKG
jgi:hypothetical protein